MRGRFFHRIPSRIMEVISRRWYHALAGAVRSQPTRHRSGEVLLPALSSNTDAAFLVSTLHFPPEQERYLGYAVIIPTLIFIGHSGRALKALGENIEYYPSGTTATM